MLLYAVVACMHACIHTSHFALENVKFFPNSEKYFAMHVCGGSIQKEGQTVYEGLANLTRWKDQRIVSLASWGA
jgi:hypothetical protein